MTKPSSSKDLSPADKRRLLTEILQKRAKQADKYTSLRTKSSGKKIGQTKAGGIPSVGLDEGMAILVEQAKWHVSIGEENPFFRVFDGPMRAEMQSDGRPVVNFSSYDYVGLSCDPRVQEASCEAIRALGTSVAASRIASGERPLHAELERGLASFFGTEDALAMVSGFGTNESVLGHIAGPGDLILYDMYMHRSAIEGARLSGAQRMPFAHNDLDALKELLTTDRKKYKNCFILVEALYSMDGDTPDLPRLMELKEEFEAFLFLDEAHSIGVLGKTGRGLAEQYGIDRSDIDITMGTLSKSFASCGGYIAASTALVRYLRYSTPGFVFSVGLSPANAASALKALQIMREEPERARKCQRNGRRFYEGLKALGLDTGHSEGYAVTPLIVGSSENAVRVSNRLFEQGVNAQAIYFPAVPESLARLRFFITQSHTEKQLDDAVALIAKVHKEVCGG